MQSEAPCSCMDTREVLVVNPTGSNQVDPDYLESEKRLEKWFVQRLAETIGFITSTPENIPTTLKRYRSDFSAATTLKRYRSDFSAAIISKLVKAESKRYKFIAVGGLSWRAFGRTCRNQKVQATGSRRRWAAKDKSEAIWAKAVTGGNTTFAKWSSRQKAARAKMMWRKPRHTGTGFTIAPNPVDGRLGGPLRSRGISPDRWAELFRPL
uniref:Uncharacterized protein n=1 Tax=Oryza glaberrima TaxID=4538 RepID=I1QNL3_ORYGL